MTAANDYSDLHELIDCLEPDQADELREHALKLVRPASSRFKVLRVFSGPSTDLGARAGQVIRAELGQGESLNRTNDAQAAEKADAPSVPGAQVMMRDSLRYCRCG